ncbi:MAG: GNAT family N-acetyltransferase [Actinomycetota bacterium]
MPAIKNPEPALEDDVVALRPFTLMDVPRVTQACQDPEIPRWTARIPSPYRESDARDWIVSQANDLRQGTEISLAITDPSTGSLDGSVGLSSIETSNGTAEIGYWVAAWARRQGKATNSVQLLSGWGLEELGLRRIILVTKPDNEASAGVARRAGYRFEEEDGAYPVRGELWHVLKFVLER